MKAIGIGVISMDGRDFGDLFDNGEPQPVVVAVDRLFVETAEQSFFIQLAGGAGVADDEQLLLQCNGDLPGRNIVIGGVAEQVVKQDVQQFRTYHQPAVLQ